MVTDYLHLTFGAQPGTFLQFPAPFLFQTLLAVCGRVKGFEISAPLPFFVFLTLSYCHNVGTLTKRVSRTRTTIDLFFMSYRDCCSGIRSCINVLKYTTVCTHAHTNIHTQPTLRRKIDLDDAGGV